jgi:hypothetical protein
LAAFCVLAVVTAAGCPQELPVWSVQALQASHRSQLTPWGLSTHFGQWAQSMQKRRCLEVQAAGWQLEREASFLA